MDQLKINQELVVEYFNLRNDLLTRQGQIRWLQSRNDQSGMKEIESEISSLEDKISESKNKLGSVDLPAAAIQHSLMAQINKYITNLEEGQKIFRDHYPDMNQGMNLNNVIIADLVRDLRSNIASPSGVNIVNLIWNQRCWDVTILIEFLKGEHDILKESKFTSTLEAVNYYEALLAKVNGLIDQINASYEN